MALYITARYYHCVGVYCFLLLVDEYSLGRNHPREHPVIFNNPRAEGEIGHNTRTTE